MSSHPDTSSLIKMNYLLQTVYSSYVQEFMAACKYSTTCGGITHVSYLLFQSLCFLRWVQWIVTYGSLDFGIKVPSSLIRSLMLNRRLLSTRKIKKNHDFLENNEEKMLLNMLLKHFYSLIFRAIITHSNYGYPSSAFPLPLLVLQLLGESKCSSIKQIEKYSVVQVTNSLDAH